MIDTVLDPLHRAAGHEGEGGEHDDACPSPGPRLHALAGRRAWMMATGQLLENLLDRDIPIQYLVMTTPNAAHPALANRLGQPEAPADKSATPTHHAASIKPAAH